MKGLSGFKYVVITSTQGSHESLDEKFKWASKDTNLALN